MNDVAVEARGLCKSYPLPSGALVVLLDASLVVRKGVMVAIRGPSGCGKSTLLNLVGGLDKPDAGSIRIAGEDVGSLSPTALAAFRRQHLGFVFQRFNLFSALTALGNVIIPLRVINVKGRDAIARAQRALEKVSLLGKSAQHPRKLSVGEMQRVAIARAIATNASVILADEPTGNLDEHNKTVVVDLLDQLRKENNVTIILATHDVAVAARCDEEYEITNGCLSRVRP